MNGEDAAARVVAKNDGITQPAAKVGARVGDKPTEGAAILNLTEECIVGENDSRDRALSRARRHARANGSALAHDRVEGTHERFVIASCNRLEGIRCARSRGHERARIVIHVETRVGADDRCVGSDRAE